MSATAILFACSVLGASAWSFDEELNLNVLEPDIPVPSPKLPSLLSLSGRSLPSPAPSTMGPLSLYLSTQPPHLQPVVPSPKMKAETTELLSDSLHGKGLKLYDVYSEAVKKLFRSGCHGGKDCGPTKKGTTTKTQLARSKVTSKTKTQLARSKVTSMAKTQLARSDPPVWAVQSNAPSFVPSLVPTTKPSSVPTAAPSTAPSALPTLVPTKLSDYNSLSPSLSPSTPPTAVPSFFPSTTTRAPVAFTFAPNVLPEERWQGTHIPSMALTQAPNMFQTKPPLITRSPTKTPACFPTAPDGAVVKPARLPNIDPAVTRTPSSPPTKVQVTNTMSPEIFESAPPVIH